MQSSSDIPSKLLALIAKWRFRIRRVQLAHNEAARKFVQWHVWLGLPVIILSTIVGTSVFATLQKSTAQNSRPDLQIAVGLLSVLAAILASLQTFLRYSDLAERHRIAGARCASLKHQIELVAILPPTTDETMREALTAIESQWSKIREDSPTIPRKIWHRIEQTVVFDNPFSQDSAHDKKITEDASETHEH